jgi:hypothetical protein
MQVWCPDLRSKGDIHVRDSGFFSLPSRSTCLGPLAFAHWRYPLIFSTVDSVKNQTIVPKKAMMVPEPSHHRAMWLANRTWRPRHPDSLSCLAGLTPSSPCMSTRRQPPIHHTPLSSRQWPPKCYKSRDHGAISLRTVHNSCRAPGSSHDSSFLAIKRCEAIEHME